MSKYYEVTRETLNGTLSTPTAGTCEELGLGVSPRKVLENKEKKRILSILSNFLRGFVGIE